MTTKLIKWDYMCMSKVRPPEKSVTIGQGQEDTWTDARNDPFKLNAGEVKLS